MPSSPRPTLLCVPIMVQDEASAAASAVAARDAGADIVEFRIDELFSGTLDSAGNLNSSEVGAVLRLVAGCPLPCIVTCRSASEGGHYDGDEMARVSLYEILGTAGMARPGSTSGAASQSVEQAGIPASKLHPPKYLDIEHAAYTRSANLKHKVHLAIDYPYEHRDVRSGLILSMHDFQGRPKDLLRRVLDMQMEDAARIVKVAITARSIRDNLELFDLLTEHAAGGGGGGKPMIALAMGQFGLLSRVLAPKFGGFLTFASLGKQTATAPGQPSVRELVDIYRFRHIHARTKVYGLVGWPVEHSMSPLVHNAGFEALVPDTWETDETGRSTSHDGVYLPLPVPAEYEHFKATLGALIDHPKLDFSGCSVTIPHKQHLVRFAKEEQAAGDMPWEIDELSLACGAANTLVIERDRLGSALRAKLVNTDAKAAVDVLSEALGKAIAGKRIALIGAGGVARAIAAGLALAGASVLIFNRTLEPAQSLASELSQSPLINASSGSIAALGMESLADTSCDAIINCTPVGMKHGPSEKQSSVDVAALRSRSPEAVVMDTVYNPITTPLLEQAALAGLKTVDGLAMFVRQAGAQFELWTGSPAPIRLFDRICREHLGV